MKDNQI